MAGYYKYIIKHFNNGFRFALYPNNNNNQPIAKSTHYFKTIAECEDDLKQFIDFVKNNNCFEHLTVEECKNGFIPKLSYDSTIEIDRKHCYSSKKDAYVNWVEKIKKNIDAVILTEEDLSNEEND